MGYTLLNVDQNAKTVKGQKKGYLTGILYLAPANESGYETCPGRSKGCTASCLFTAGNAQRFKNINVARVRKTKLLFEHPTVFFSQLIADIATLRMDANKKGLTPVIRLNGTSDIGWENMPVQADFKGLGMVFKNGEYNIFDIFSDIQFYDYTKRLDRRELDNYRLTFSRSESNGHKVMKAIEAGLNVAVVFEKVPQSWAGMPVIDGDENDLRFLDPKGVIVGLKAKGKARKDASGFVVSLGDSE